MEQNKRLVQSQLVKRQDKLNHLPEEYYDEIMLGQNQKLQLVDFNDMSSLPYNCIAALILKQNGKVIGLGSGFMISADLVLTCAHNLFHNMIEFKKQIVRIYPGQFGQLGPGYTADTIYIPQQYKAKRNPEHDYALIKLTQKLKLKHYLNLNSNFNIIAQKSYKIAIFGYPGTSYDVTSKQRQMHFQRGLTKQVKDLELYNNQKMIKHSISTKGGQSGCPIVLVSDKNNLSVIGIHKGGFKINNQFFNAARLITKQLVANLLQEAMEMGAELFKVVGQMQVKKEKKIIKRNSTVIMPLKNEENEKYKTLNDKRLIVNTSAVNPRKKIKQFFTGYIASHNKQYRIGFGAKKRFLFDFIRGYNFHKACPEDRSQKLIFDTIRPIEFFEDQQELKSFSCRITNESDRTMFMVRDDRDKDTSDFGNNNGGREPITIRLEKISNAGNYIGTMSVIGYKIYQSADGNLQWTSHNVSGTPYFYFYINQF